MNSKSYGAPSQFVENNILEKTTTTSEMIIFLIIFQETKKDVSM